MDRYDLIIIGGGPGGYTAAIRAGQLGFKTALLEKDALGGVCLNRGCIPTKCLSAAAETVEQAKNARRRGITFDALKIDAPRLFAWKDQVITNLQDGVASLLKSNGVTVFPREGKLLSRTEVRAGNDTPLKGEHVILATGSRPLKPEAFFSGKLPGPVTSDELLRIRKIPETLAVVGGGYIGCEFASIFAALGSRVSIYELLPRLLPAGDAEISRELERAFKKRGIRVTTGQPVTPAELKDSETALVAVGRRPNTEDLGLDKAGVDLDQGGAVKTDRFLRTTAENVYAIGDVNGKGQLAYLAAEQGVTVVEGLRGARREISTRFIPTAVFTSPEAAGFGLTEEELPGDKENYRVGKFPFAALGKAHCLAKAEGFVKIIAEKDTGRIMGCHIIGAGATELIHLVSAVAAAEGTVETITETIFAHPVLSESIKEASLAAFNRALHLPRQE